MSKRKLNRRQSWRINKIQQERIERASKKDQQIDASLQSGELGPEQQGLIVSHFGSQVDVEVLEGEHRGEIQRCHMRANLGALVTGDKVVWRKGHPYGVIVATLPRHSLLSRPNSRGELRPVAANIDYIVITIAPEPTPFANLIDRYLVAAEVSGIEPVILLNKTDLLTEPERRAELDKMLASYEQIGYKVLHASTLSEEGLRELKAELDQRTSVFVGQSGVGKSSLINTLLPGVDIKVGALSEAKLKGTHTTTTARIYHFPDGGDLIDSPGIREFGLWHIEPEQLLEGFVEFRPFLGHCRFRDCKHQQEPSCALLEALEQGKIEPRRMESYRLIRQSLEDGIGPH
ncbi:small ribosomal subunit biogenesis GTPase RsgA [Motiliproteus coralliicola]|uniref:Small ribosomal subunit biogenesis GTPase RsgA n=1 Tax=Motiliproteus coralliicola TaxID=2283196 RepID=A0A369WC92_9GAMM|nr:small ribosomal subunit biogenesis GTPase RsgA [Motiliproteus coralliicola]RDE19638.1 small ribosomal subunit biogenesis GTPase RsgA [Motiliproteus coralliicola]